MDDFFRAYVGQRQEFGKFFSRATIDAYWTPIYAAQGHTHRRHYFAVMAFIDNIKNVAGDMY